MNDPAQFWADPRLVYLVAAAAVSLLLITIWLFRRRHRQGRQAAVICLLISVALHLALIMLVPLLSKPSGGSSTPLVSEKDVGTDTVAFSTFDPDMNPADAAGQDETPITPLPVSDLTDLLAEESTPDVEPVESTENETTETQPQPGDVVPDTLATQPREDAPDMMAEIDSQFGEVFEAAIAPDQPEMASSDSPLETAKSSPQPPAATATVTDASTPAKPVSTSTAPKAVVPGDLKKDFANRVGAAKELALQRTGGNAETEAAVEAALRFLAESQRPDGSWDPRASGAGKELAPLGTNRQNAGARADTAITGLALLTMIGAGNTHQRGDYADNVYRGLAYLIRTQKPNGSLAGNASVYASTYSHGMAALAMCEAAAITGDESAIAACERATNYTVRLQHPTSGGWRYVPGDPGDLSQLGWQAMVLDAGHRAGVAIPRKSVSGIQRFLRTVRAGTHGGLASYRQNEAPSRTMTAEALATRLLIGDKVPALEIVEAERSILLQPPGVGQDNYYYWYYATLALHQLQDDAWDKWNQALQRRLLSTQHSDGGWNADTMWGGYGGSVYTTSMAALCLETYYRHTVRGGENRIATRPALVGQDLRLKR